MLGAKLFKNDVILVDVSSSVEVCASSKLSDVVSIPSPIEDAPNNESGNIESGFEINCVLLSKYDDNGVVCGITNDVKLLLGELTGKGFNNDEVDADSELPFNKSFILFDPAIGEDDEEVVIVL